jgi:hypothetical protein
MIKAQKIARNSKHPSYGLNPAIEEAIISLKLAEITLNDETITDLILFSQEKLSEEEAIQRALIRVKGQPK